MSTVSRLRPAEKLPCRPRKELRAGVSLLLAAALLALGTAYPSLAAAQGGSDDADLAGLTLVRPSTLQDVLSEDARNTLRLTSVQPPLAVPLNESFAAGTTAYTADVRDHVREVLVTPALNDSNATVTVNGSSPATPVSLSAGENVINILVTAQDGVTTKNYKVTVTRTEFQLLDRDLSGLTATDSNGSAIPMVPNASHLSRYALHQVPQFYPYVSHYSLWVPADVSSVTITPTWTWQGSDYWVEVRAATDFEHPTRRNMLATVRVSTSGQATTAVPLAENLLKTTEIWVGVHGPGGGARLYFLDVVRGTWQDAYSDTKNPVPQDPVDQGENLEAQTQAPPTGVSKSQLTGDGAEGAAAEAPPGPVQDLSLKAKGSRVIVSWNAPAGGGPPSGYQVKLEDSDGGEAKTRRPGAKKLRIVYRNLESGATYEVSVRAKNEWGKSAWTSAQITVE